MMYECMPIGIFTYIVIFVVMVTIIVIIINIILIFTDIVITITTNSGVNLTQPSLNNILRSCCGGNGRRHAVRSIHHIGGHRSPDCCAYLLGRWVRCGRVARYGRKLHNSCLGCVTPVCRRVHLVVVIEGGSFVRGVRGNSTAIF